MKTATLKNELRVKNETVCTYQNFNCKKFVLPNLPGTPNFCVYTNFLLIYIFKNDYANRML